MAANLPDTEGHSMKRRREQSHGDSEDPPGKRHKKEKVVLLEEISVETYFSLLSQEQIDDSQAAMWLAFKAIVKKCFPRENRGIDDNSLVVYVPQSVLPALERINYKETNLDKLKITLEKWTKFINLLSRLRHSLRKDKEALKKSEQECEPLFLQLKERIGDRDIDLTLTQEGGWNVIHIAAGFGRIDILIQVQWYLLSKKLEQYECLLCAETNRAKAQPISMKKAPHHEEFVSLLIERSLPLLKEKQFAVILKMLVAYGKEPQYSTLYGQLKQLIAEGVDPTATEDTRGLNILYFAVYMQDVELVKHILQHASLKQSETLLKAETNNTKSTAYSRAKYYNYGQILSLLKENKALIEIFNDLGGLKTIAEADKQLLYERIKQFIENGGDPTFTDDRGLNFLHYAAFFQDITLGRLIIDNAKPEDYRALLSAQSQKQKLTPYDIVLKSKKKNSEYENLLKLLNPEANQNISQPSQKSYGEFPFFSSTRLSDEDKPEPEPYPEANQKISQPSQKSCGEFPFFSPTRLSDEAKPEPEPSQAISSPAMQRSP